MSSNETNTWAIIVERYARARSVERYKIGGYFKSKRIARIRGRIHGFLRTDLHIYLVPGDKAIAELDQYQNWLGANRISIRI